MDSTCVDGFKGLRILRNLSETESFSCHCGSIFKTPMRLQEHIDLFHSCSSIFIDLNGDVLWRDYNADKKKKTKRKVGPLCYQKMLPSIEEEPVTEDEGNQTMNANVQPSSPTPAIQSKSKSECESEPEPNKITNDPISAKESPLSSEKSESRNAYHDTEISDRSNIVMEKQQQQNPHDQCMTLTNINLETGALVYNCDSSSCSTVIKTAFAPSPQNIIDNTPAPEELHPQYEIERENLNFHLQDEENTSGESPGNYTNTSLSQTEKIHGSWSVVKCEPLGENESDVSKLSGHDQNSIYNSLDYEGNSENIPLHSHQHHHNDQNSNTTPMMSNDSLNETLFSPGNQSTILMPMKIEGGISVIPEDNCNTNTSDNISLHMHENMFHVPSSSSSMMTVYNDFDGDQDEDDIYSSCQETVLGSMAKSPELPSDDMETTSIMHETSTSRRKAKRKRSFDPSEPTRSLRSLPGRPKRFCN